MATPPPPFDPNRTEGIIAITFIVFSFVLLVILLTTCIICCCWRYKLHKRKTELKAKDAAQGIITKRKSAGCCHCCGCWLYCCRCCRGCCEPKPVQEDMMVVDVPPVPRPSEPFGWSKDVYVYNNSGPPAIGMGGGGGGCGGGCTSQPVNFNNRWSASNDGRLVLNTGGIASKYVPGAAGVYGGGGIYPSIPGPGALNNQFVLTRK